MARLLLGHEHCRESLYRIDHTVQRNEYKMDDAKIIKDLKGLGHVKGRERFPLLEPTFFDTTAEAFVPHYKLDDGEKNANWTEQRIPSF